MVSALFLWSLVANPSEATVSSVKPFSWQDANRDYGPTLAILCFLWCLSLPSMEILSDMFELDLPTVHSIISKMIINEELMVRTFAIKARPGVARESNGITGKGQEKCCSCSETA